MKWVNVWRLRDTGELAIGVIIHESKQAAIDGHSNHYDEYVGPARLSTQDFLIPDKLPEGGQ